MNQYPIHTHFPGRLICIGFGSIGQGVLPLILRHVGGLSADRITIVTADEAGREEAAEFGIKFLNHPLTRENFRHVLDPLVGRGDFVLNLSVDVSSIALIKLCHEKGALHQHLRLITCPQPCPHRATQLQTTYAARHQFLELDR
jgi:homospermidine synthase